MPFNYNKLWKLLIDKGMTKEALRKQVGMSPSTIAKMGKNKNVSLDLIEKICKVLECKPEDIMEYIKDSE